MTEVLEPLFNNVLLREVDPGERRTTGGLVLAGKSKESTAVRAEVVAVGPGEPLPDQFSAPDAAGRQFQMARPVDLQVGDHVVVPAFQGFKHVIDGVEYLLAKDTEILAVVRRAQ